MCEQSFFCNAWSLSLSWRVYKHYFDILLTLAKCREISHFVGQVGIENLIMSVSFKFSAPLLINRSGVAGQKKAYYAFLADFWCSVVTLVTFQRNLNKFKKNLKYPKEIQKVQIYQKFITIFKSSEQHFRIRGCVSVYKQF